VASKGRRYKTVVVEGYEVLIGKGDAENDELTFALAAPEDFWLHVAGGVPGSHVVVRNPERLDALPRAVVEQISDEITVALELHPLFGRCCNERRLDLRDDDALGVGISGGVSSDGKNVTVMFCVHPRMFLHFELPDSMEEQSRDISRIPNDARLRDVALLLRASPSWNC